MHKKNNKWLNCLLSEFFEKSKYKIVFEEKDQLKKPYPVINLSIHPLRFADDIFLNFNTNDDHAFEMLKRHEVDYDIFFHYANLVKERCAQLKKGSICKNNSLILVGQTERDKVIFDGDQFLKLTDFLESIEEISSQYEHVYFKPHPYAKNNKDIFNELKRIIKKCYITFDNIYFLLSDNNVKALAGLNSSVLYESKYFYKKSFFLFKETFNFIDSDIGIYGDYYNSSFWSSLLGVEDKGKSLPSYPNRLRKLVNDSWAYGEINNQIIFTHFIKNKIKKIISKYFY